VIAKNIAISIEIYKNKSYNKSRVYHCCFLREGLTARKEKPKTDAKWIALGCLLRNLA